VGGAADTIFALSSAPGRAAVAVVRLAGPAAGPALAALLGGRLPEPRRAALRKVRDPDDGELLDAALVLWLPGPGTETGEDMAELQLHGAPSVVAGVLEALGRQPGLRLAEPGEFTRRAFDNGRLDLTAVEGLADLIAAETALQRRQALALAGGALSRRLEAWRGQLARALARLEAAIDFPDEGLPEGLGAESLATLERVGEEIAEVLAGAERGERLRQGLRVALIGAPNAGKSSLLNALARRPVAIVAPTPGTTRDVLELHLDLGGLPVTLVDTAGLRAETADPVEQEGMRRARQAAAAADLVLYLVDVGAAYSERPPDLALGADLDRASWITVGTKCDLPARQSVKTDLSVSSLTGAGLEGLLDCLRDRLCGLAWSGAGSAPLVTRMRQRAALRETLAALRRAASAGAVELVAEDLRLALRGLGRVAGRVDVEELLDLIFRDFCIGK
jgi:tRNA modification GTPase